MSQIASKKADDKVYTYDKRYEMTYISDDPDSEFPEKMLTALMYCTHDSHYTSDGLHHDKFVVYY